MTCTKKIDFFDFLNKYSFYEKSTKDKINAEHKTESFSSKTFLSKPYRNRKKIIFFKNHRTPPGAIYRSPPLPILFLRLTSFCT